MWFGGYMSGRRRDGGIYKPRVYWGEEYIFGLGLMSQDWRGRIFDRQTRLASLCLAWARWSLAGLSECHCAFLYLERERESSDYGSDQGGYGSILWDENETE